MPQYVILFHSTPPGSLRALHWDMMLEDEGVLRTWALSEEPSTDRPIAAERIADHRLMYLDYEGPISGDRGEVRQWDAGTYRVQRRSAQQWEIVLAGRRLSGDMIIERQGGEAQRWRIILSTD